MGKKEILMFKEVEQAYGHHVLKNALQMTTDDIRFNKIVFGKRTSSRDFMDVFFKSLRLCIKVGV